MLKVKNFRVKKKNNIETLDIKHQELIDKFDNDILFKIPRLKFERKLLYNEFKNCILNEQIQIKELINKIDKEINTIKNNKKNYLVNNSSYIFEYFEDKKKISVGNNSTKLTNNFFNIVDTSNINVSKNSISNIEKYFQNIYPNNINLNQYTYKNNFCEYCKKGELIQIDSEGLLVCNNCYNSIRYLVDSDKPSYKEPPKEVSFYAYKRINHFREILAQFQAKETTLIPTEVIENIKLQIKKERLELSTTTNNNLKDILKKLKYNKYYEHIPFIKDKLGIKPPVMSLELEETLCNLFIELQTPYAKFCPLDRVNFLNYYYTIYKLCELLNQKQFLEYFPMLKDRDKRIEQDEIWKKICKELNWQFIPTI